MSQPKKSKAWPELGIITKNPVKDKEGNILKDSNGQVLTKLGFKLNDDVTVFVKGVKVDTSGFGVLKTPVEEVESLYKNGVLGDDVIEEKRQGAAEIYKWLRYKIQLTPPKST